MQTPLRAVALASLMQACALWRPALVHNTRPAPARERVVVRVAVDHRQAPEGLATGYDEYVRAAVRALDASDPTRHWELVPGLPDADVIVRHAPSRGRGACVVAGFFEPGSRIVQVDPACAPGAVPLASVVLHELLHWAGGAHVCLRAGELPDRDHPREACSPVGYGCAVLNPAASDDGGACASGLANGELTDLDRAELRRSH